MRSGNHYHFCIYCMHNYEEQLEKHQLDPKQFKMPAPVKSIRQRISFLRRHLDVCQAYKEIAGTIPKLVSVSGAAFSKSITSTASRGTQQDSAPSSPLSTPSKNPDDDQEEELTPEQLEEYFTGEQLKEFYGLVMEFCVELNLPFDIVKRPSFLRLIEHLRPGISHQLAESYLF
jgi:hypothetical protein